MRVVVVEIFKDRYTKEVYKKGKELKVNTKRYREIKEFVKIIKTKKEENRAF